MRFTFILFTVILLCPKPAINAEKEPQKTKVNNRKALKLLTGKHLFSLQWISWVNFGEAVVTNDAGLLKLNAIQRSTQDNNYILMQGVITNVDEREFIFDGIIITKINHLNYGLPCERQGVMTFLIPEGKKYWRLQEMQNPCDEVVDYIDIFE